MLPDELAGDMQLCGEVLGLLDWSVESGCLNRLRTHRSGLGVKGKLGTTRKLQFLEKEVSTCPQLSWWF